MTSKGTRLDPDTEVWCPQVAVLPAYTRVPAQPRDRGGNEEILPGKKGPRHMLLNAWHLLGVLASALWGCSLKQWLQVIGILKSQREAGPKMREIQAAWPIRTNSRVQQSATVFRLLGVATLE